MVAAKIKADLCTLARNNTYHSRHSAHYLYSIIGGGGLRLYNRESPHREFYSIHGISSKHQLVAARTLDDFA